MVRLRALPLAVFAVLAVLSGCVGILTTNVPGGSPSATTEVPASVTAEPTPTDPTTPTETDEWCAGCSATPSTDPADRVPSDATVFDYASLSTERHTESDAAVGGSNSAENTDTASLSERTDIYEFWVGRLYVRYKNETYGSVIAIR